MKAKDRETRKIKTKKEDEHLVLPKEFNGMSDRVVSIQNYFCETACNRTLI